MSKLEGLRWRATTMMGRALARHKGVRIGKNVRFLGLPIISGAGDGLISLGDNVVLASSSHATALGVRSRVIMRCLCAGAILRIGADTGLSGTVICAAQRVEVGDRCLIGADVMIFDTDFHNHEPAGRRYGSPRWAEISRAVSIGNDVFIGTRAMICKGVTIGDGSVIAAGSIVTTDIPANTVAGGVPARPIGMVPGAAGPACAPVRETLS
jgi:acetyltransferase-like isoleucine patch superfamily enzyme